MPASLDVYLEVGAKRVFAGAVEWPGWCRAAKTEDDALQALVDYAARYAKALGSASRGVPKPKAVSDLQVVERVKGDATTDFGAPGQSPKADARPLDAAELKRQIKLWTACRSAFVAAAAAAKGKTLAKGPRGGGRDLDAIVAHVFDADGSYLRLIGGKFTLPEGQTPSKAMPAQADAIVEALTASAHGEPPEYPRRVDRYWTARYVVRRSAWHALDHAWEIEDRTA
jgi:predicted RNase H-like HicB family nuclease